MKISVRLFYNGSFIAAFHHENLIAGISSWKFHHEYFTTKIHHRTLIHFQWTTVDLSGFHRGYFITEISSQIFFMKVSSQASHHGILIADTGYFMPKMSSQIFFHDNFSAAISSRKFHRRYLFMRISTQVFHHGNFIKDISS